MKGTRSNSAAFDPGIIDATLKRLDPDQRQHVAVFLAESVRYLGLADGGEHRQLAGRRACGAFTHRQPEPVSGSARC